MTTKSFKCAAILWSRAVLGQPAVVLIAKDGTILREEYAT